ncbi:MAG: Hsp70 family protein, partial [Alphaproteobacteria bacterium]|nr:Hsp70 family protein [Alphaproteobacteria bacterium]
MSSASPAVSIGIDFGTSNTVVAFASSDGHVESLRFEHGGTSISVYASALCFWQDHRGTGLPPRAEGGPWAIERFLDSSDPLRFIQSFKSFAASESFQSTTIFQQRFEFEDLLSAFLRTLMRHAGTGLDLGGARIIIGRPVRFSGANPDDALAMRRYREAFGRLGV